MCESDFDFLDIQSNVAFEEDCVVVTLEGVDRSGEIVARMEVQECDDQMVWIDASFVDGFGTIEAAADGSYRFSGSLDRAGFEQRVFAAQQAFTRRIATGPTPPQAGWLSCMGATLSAAATCAAGSVCTATTEGACAPIAWTACTAASINFLCACCKGSSSLVCNKIKDAC